MSVVQRFRRVVARHGIAGACYKAYAVLVDRWFDFRYGVDTCGTVPLESLQVAGENQAHGHRYEPARVAELRRTLARLRELAGPDTLLVDLGSGKGRILMVGAEVGFRRAIGVEFAAELCESARKNFQAFQESTGNTADLTIFEGDVLSYPIENCDTLFTLFNPFDDVITERFFERLARSAAEHPRRILICLYNTPTVDLIRRVTSFEVIEQTDHFGYQTIVLENRRVR